MEYIIQIIYGAVQGITEFLPISSSGHLVILHKILPLGTGNELAFDVFLHLASLLAVLIIFYPDLKRIFFGFFQGIGKSSANKEVKLALNIVISTLPAAFLGLFFNDVIEQYFRSVYVVVAMLILIGVYMLIAERKPGKSNLDMINWKTALFIGLTQAVALIPGTSRSGITIATAIIIGLQRREAVRYSFLISIPVIFGACVLKIANIDPSEIVKYLPAFISTFVFAFIAIKWLLSYTKNKGLKPFSYYRFALAMLLMLILLF